MGIRDLFNLGTPHAPEVAKNWGEAVSDAIDNGTSTVFYGSDVNTARPRVGGGPVVWVGHDGVVPANAVDDFDIVFTFVPAEAVVAPTSAPTGLSTTVISDTRIDLSWNAVTGENVTGYEYDVNEGVPVDVGNNLAAEVTGLSPATSYDFRVRAYNSTGAGPWSAVVVGTTDAEASAPAAPTNLAATGGDSQVSLTWTASAGADGHRVYRHTANDFALASQVGADLGAAANSYTDSTVTNDTEYFYWVTAFNTNGESDPSTVDSATPAAVVQGDYETEVLADNPFAYWRFQEESGTNLSDSAGSNDATLIGGTLGVNGPIDKAITFNGTISQYVDLTTLGLFGESIPSSSIEVWARWTSSGAMKICGVTSPANNDQLNLWVNYNSSANTDNGNILAVVRTNNDSGTNRLWFAPTTNPGLNDGEWHHIVIVIRKASGEGDVYIDGAPVSVSYNHQGTGTNSMALDVPLYAGAGNENGSPADALDGSIAELALYVTNLSAQRVSDHYSAAT